MLSAKGRGGLGMNQIEDYLQTDASINPGNSGGPLCDLDGRVLGINTMIVGRGTGIGFAVPSNLARRAAEQILKNGHVQRSWIGVGIQDLTPELASAMKVDSRAGVLVNSINDGGPAAKANIKAGDIIGAVAGKKVIDGRELVREVIAHEVGQTIQLEIVRDGKKYGTNMTLTARPEAAVPPLPVQQQGVPQAGLGLSVRDLTPQQSSQLGLSPEAPADRHHASRRAPPPIARASSPATSSSRPTASRSRRSNQLSEQAKDGQLLVRVRRRDASFYAAMKK